MTRRSISASLHARFVAPLARIFSLAFVCLLSAGTVVAQSKLPVGGLGKGAGPRLGVISQVEVAITNRADVERLVKAGYDVENVRRDRVTLYADGDELASLRAEGWFITILKLPPALPGLPSAKSLGTYNNYSNLTAMLDGYATNYPALVRKVSVGKSVQNRDLWAVKITSNPDAPADKPRFKYISTMHGNEPVGTEMCLYLMDRLLKGYATNDARIVNLVTNVEVWFLPMMNPDGREAAPPQRYNASGYDLNRSFPEGAGTNLGNTLYGPPMNTNGLPAEVRHVMNWTAAHSFTLGANFHSGDLLVNYPYDNDGLGSVSSPSPDDALFQVISRAYSSNNLPMWNSPSFANGIVNGAAWYAITGGMQDWNYRFAGCFDVTIELSSGQWPDPPAAELPTYWSQNQESMLQYLEWSLRGVRGIIRNARTGEPVAGAVRVAGFHHLMFSDPAVGDYHRLLLPGTYTLWFSAPGFVPQRIPNVVVGGAAATRLDVALEPVSTRFAVKINFQPTNAPVPAGFSVDSGGAFGPQTGGYNYGWETTLSVGTVLQRNAGRSQDLRYDTLSQMQSGGNHIWEIAVPNGPCSVLLAAGDPAQPSGTYRIKAEGVLLLDGVPSSSNRWVEALGTVVVTDGRLTLSNDSGAVSNRLAYLEISAVEPATVAQWRAQFFGTTNNTGNAADNASPDGDSTPNLLEYALGLSPTNYDATSPLSPVLFPTNSATWFGVTFLRNTNATDLTWQVQAAPSPVSTNWSALATLAPGSNWTGPGAFWETAATQNCARVTVLNSQPADIATNRFLRLQVSHP